MPPRTALRRSIPVLALGLLLALGGCTTLLQRPSVVTETNTAPASGAHLTLGNPSGAVADERQPNNYLIERGQYALSYSRDRGIPNWVSWHLQQSDLGDTPRYEGQFIADTSLPDGWYQVTHDDYSGSGYDRGHMTPSADRTASPEDNEATFILTNVLPQAPESNQGPWKDLEDETRDLVRGDGDEAYIIAGGWGSKREALAGGNLTIPEAVWKVLVFLPERAGDDVPRITRDTFTIAIWMPNDSSVAGKPWDAFQTTIACIEQRTGLDLIAAVPDDVEAALAGTDCDGRMPRGAGGAGGTDSPQGAPVVEPTTPPAATVYALTITEVMADPPGDDAAGEYVALQNTGSAPLDMNGWTLADEAGATFTFPPFTLDPGASVRVWVASGTDDAQNLYWGLDRAVWNNAGDTATVSDAGGYLWADQSYP